MKKIFLSVCALWIAGVSVNAQVNVGSTAAPNADAMLQVTSSNKGLLLPNVALTATNAAAPLSGFVAGMTVYNTATAGTAPNNVTPGYYYSDGTQWIKIASINLYSSDGALAGNRTVTMGTNNLVFNGTGGNVGINNTTPTSSVSINGSLAAKYNSGNSTYTLTASDYFYNWSGSAATAIDLPAGASGDCNCSGRMYIIKNNSATATANLTVTPNGSETIDGKASYVLAPQQTLQLINTGAASGNTWTILNATNSGTTTQGATVLVGGSIYSHFNQNTNGTLSTSNLIGGTAGSSYTVGTVSKTSAVGGMNGISGNGFTVSNPANGIYDIQFTSPFTTIYGVSVNVLDDYGTGGAVPDGQAPDNTQPGTRLSVTDNTQIAFISNNIIEIKSGDNSGNLRNRSIAFVVSGK